MLVDVNSNAIGVIGGGQLARMMQAPATSLGMNMQVLVESADGSAGQVCQHVVGLPADPAALQALADTGVQTVTFEHEHIPAEAFEFFLSRQVRMEPPLSALLYAQDKIQMRQRLQDIAPMPAWTMATTTEEVEAFLAAHGPQAIAKTPRGGYDGKGVRVISAVADVSEWLQAGEVLLEQKVDFEYEVAALVARSVTGEMRSWPVAETVQTGGVCDLVIAPAPQMSAALSEVATQLAERIAEELGVTGVLAVEMFVQGNQLLINELAMRPHNSGHWTIHGSVTSQFEQHLRAVAGLPLGSTAPVAKWTVMANILGSTLQTLPEATAGAQLVSERIKVELYGKGIRPGRKLGHVTISGEDLDEMVRLARLAAQVYMGKHE